MWQIEELTKRCNNNYKINNSKSQNLQNQSIYINHSKKSKSKNITYKTFDKPKNLHTREK